MKFVMLVFAGMTVIAVAALSIAGWLFHAGQDVPAFAILVAGAAFFFRMPAGLSGSFSEGGNR